jgi:hypothetical protein
VARIADRLHGPTFPGALVRQAYGAFLTAAPSVADAFCADIVAVLELLAASLAVAVSEPRPEDGGSIAWPA